LERGPESGRRWDVPDWDSTESRESDEDAAWRDLIARFDAPTTTQEPAPWPAREDVPPAGPEGAEPEDHGDAGQNDSGTAGLENPGTHEVADPPWANEPGGGWTQPGSAPSATPETGPANDPGSREAGTGFETGTTGFETGAGFETGGTGTGPGTRETEAGLGIRGRDVAPETHEAGTETGGTGTGSGARGADAGTGGRGIGTGPGIHGADGMWGPGGATGRRGFDDEGVRGALDPDGRTDGYEPDVIQAARRRRRTSPRSIRPRQAPLPDPAGDEDEEEHYVPPAPAPLPKLDSMAKGAWAALFGGPGYLVVATAAGWSVSGLAAFCAVAAFVTGFAILVLRMNESGPGGPDDGDNGAVV